MSEEPHLTDEWAALVGATAVLAEAAIRWDAACAAYVKVVREAEAG